MISMDALERRFGWLSFPALLRYYALFHVLAYGLHLFRPGLVNLLEFDRAKIFSGEVWRLLTFLFTSSASIGSGAFGIIAMVFLVLVAFMISDALEDAWGVFRATLYYYSCILGLVAANLLLPGVMEGAGFLFYGMAFFAFATLFPKVEFLLFFVLPVQVRWIAVIQAAGLVLSCLGDWRMVPFLLLSHAGYLVFAGIPTLRQSAKIPRSQIKIGGSRRMVDDAPAAFHECSVCGRTEQSDPDSEFRIGVDGREYCDQHLPNS
jgi:hypothetical protein